MAEEYSELFLSELERKVTAEITREAEGQQPNQEKLNSLRNTRQQVRSQSERLIAMRSATNRDDKA